MRVVLIGSPGAVAGAQSYNDLAACQKAMTNSISGYNATSIMVATGGTAAAIEHWVATRPASAGIPGGPDRGLSSVSSAAHVTVCVFNGTYSIPAPPGEPNGNAASRADGGRFFLLPIDRVVLDTEGPLGMLERTTPNSFSGSE